KPSTRAGDPAASTRRLPATRNAGADDGTAAPAPPRPAAVVGVPAPAPGAVAALVSDPPGDGASAPPGAAAVELVGTAVVVVPLPAATDGGDFAPCAQAGSRKNTATTAA